MNEMTNLDAIQFKAESSRRKANQPVQGSSLRLSSQEHQILILATTTEFYRELRHLINTLSLQQLYAIHKPTEMEIQKIPRKLLHNITEQQIKSLLCFHSFMHACIQQVFIE